MPTETYEDLLKERSDLQSQLEQLRAERETLLYWLLRAYQSGHREGWESGPSVAETMDRICDVLSNAGYDPSSDKAKGLLQEFQEQSVKSQGEM